MAQPFGAVQTLTLPTGAKVLVRRPSITSLVRSGGFPAELGAFVFKVFASDDFVKVVEGEDVEGLKRYAETVNAYIPHVLVSLRVAKEGEGTDARQREDGIWEGVVALEDLRDDDKHRLMAFGTGARGSDAEEAVARRRREAMILHRVVEALQAGKVDVAKALAEGALRAEEAPPDTLAALAEANGHAGAPVAAQAPQAAQEGQQRLPLEPAPGPEVRGEELAGFR